MQRFWALILLILLMPFLLLISLIIALVSGIPIVFTQERIGLNKKPFVIYKFRTMRHAQITILGRILRKTGMDELPQLVNIIEGNMNFVGPRPLTYADVLRLGWDSSDYSERWSVKPGITGLAQLSNVCDANVSWMNDQEYIKIRSVKTDLRIIGKSILIPITGKKSSSLSDSRNRAENSTL